MAQFELIFAVDALSDETIDLIYDSFDALVAGHGRTTLLTVTADGATALMAAKSIVPDLEAIDGVVVQRCYEDLVDRADIAQRCDTTPQAVGQWIRHVRHRETPFPEPFNHVGGGIWLWGEVNSWLRRVGKVHDGLDFPCYNDYLEINRWLADHRAGARMTTVSFNWESTLAGEFVDEHVDVRIDPPRAIGRPRSPISISSHEWTTLAVQVEKTEE